MSAILSTADLDAIRRSLTNATCINASLADGREKRGEARWSSRGPCQCWMCTYKADVTRLLGHIDATKDNVPPAAGASTIVRQMGGER